MRKSSKAARESFKQIKRLKEQGRSIEDIARVLRIKPGTV